MVTSSKTAGRKTADALIGTGIGLISGILIETDKTNDVTVVLYDNTAASGTIVFKALVPGTDDTRLFSFNNPIRTTTGIYVDVTGTGAAYTIYTV